MNYNNIRRRKLPYRLRNYIQRRRRQHDPMLVLNMSIFNDHGGWSRVFDPVKARENN